MGTFERKSRKCLLSVFIMCYNLWQNTLTKKKKKNRLLWIHLHFGLSDAISAQHWLCPYGTTMLRPAPARPKSRAKGFVTHGCCQCAASVLVLQTPLPFLHHLSPQAPGIFAGVQLSDSGTILPLCMARAAEDFTWSPGLPFTVTDNSRGKLLQLLHVPQQTLPCNTNEQDWARWLSVAHFLDKLFWPPPF